MKYFINLICFCIIFSLSAKNKEPEIGIVEKLNDFVPGDITLVNEKNEKVNLKTLITKPTVLNLVYYRCPSICTPVMQGVAEMINKCGLKLGKDYQIVTLSFNPEESIDLAIDKKKNFLQELKDKELAKEHWMYFVADSANIARLTSSVGFKYKKMGNDFSHTGTIIMLSPKRKITRYLNGTYFLPFEFKLALLEAAEGKIGSTVNRFLQFCYAYDPVGKKYAMNVTKVTGSLILFVGIIGFLLLILAKRKNIISSTKKTK